MFCGKCGKQIDDDAVFCKFCGEKIDEEGDIGVLAKPSCGKAVIKYECSEDDSGITDDLRTVTASNNDVNEKKRFPKYVIWIVAFGICFIVFMMFSGGGNSDTDPKVVSNEKSFQNRKTEITDFVDIKTTTFRSVRDKNKTPSVDMELSYEYYDNGVPKKLIMHIPAGEYYAQKIDSYTYFDYEPAVEPGKPIMVTINGNKVGENKKNETTYQRITYDSKWRGIVYEDMEADKKTISHTLKIKYDNYGNKIEELDIFPQEQDEFYWEYEYDEYNVMTKMVRGTKGVNENVFIYTYDYDDNGLPSVKYEYQIKDQTKTLVSTTYIYRDPNYLICKEEEHDDIGMIRIREYERCLKNEIAEHQIGNNSYTENEVSTNIESKDTSKLVRGQKENESKEEEVSDLQDYSLETSVFNQIKGKYIDESSGDTVDIRVPERIIRFDNRGIFSRTFNEKICGFEKSRKGYLIKVELGRKYTYAYVKEDNIEKLYVNFSDGWDPDLSDYTVDHAYVKSKDGTSSSDGNSGTESTGEVNNEARNDTNNDGQVFPYSSQELISADVIRQLSDADIRYAINELYARHGYIFKNKDLLEYYSQFDWYDPMVPANSFSMNVFNKTESQNLKLLQQERDRRK